MTRHPARQPTFLLAALVLGCASTSEGPLPPGDALEAADPPPTVQDVRGRPRIPASRQPTQDELASAFDPPSVRTVPRAPTGQGNVPRTPVPDDPLASLRADFQARETKVRSLVRTRSPEAAGEAKTLQDAAEALGPAEVERASALRHDAARALGDDREAHALAWKWLFSCDSHALQRCRRRAQAAIARAAPATRDPKQAKERLKSLRRADACLKTLEAKVRARAAEPPACADDALRTFRLLGDDLQLAKTFLALASLHMRAAGEAGQAERALKKAAEACRAPRCAPLRQRALESLSALHLREGELEAAARAALRAVSLHQDALPASQRLFAWTPAATRACQALDDQAGPGACRRLERALTGAHAFFDYSQKKSGRGLTPDQVREVNAHFGVTFKPCLAEEARRLLPPAEVRYLVRWVVQNDGRVGEMHMDRKDRDQGPLAECLRQKLSVWRYPRFEGEYQHVEQAFAVRAVRR